MKKIVEHRKILGANKEMKLDELKSLYRNFMKEFHPDKFQDNDENKIHAEEKSKKIIEAYHSLVSIAPETNESNKEEYAETIANAGIKDIEYKAKRLRIDFNNGCSYEYISVPENTYVKLINADSQARFIRRHISTSFIYRQVSKSAVTV